MSDAGDTTEVTSTEIDSKETEQSDHLLENESTEESIVDVKTEIAYDGIFPEHEPYGTGIGAMPGRVVWAHNPDSVSWDGSEYWWETDHFDEEPILQMVNESIASLGGNGYQTGEKIAIKANMNGSAVFDNDTSGETNMSYTNSVLLKTLLCNCMDTFSARKVEVKIAFAMRKCYTIQNSNRTAVKFMCKTGRIYGTIFNTGII